MQFNCIWPLFSFARQRVRMMSYIKHSDLLYHYWAKMANTKRLPTYFFKIQVTIFLKKIR